MAVEKLSKLCFRGSGRGADQSVGEVKIKIRGIRRMSPHFYIKEGVTKLECRGRTWERAAVQSRSDGIQ